jgi:hypothetical protein
MVIRTDEWWGCSPPETFGSAKAKMRKEIKMKSLEIKYESPAHTIFENKGKYKDNDVLAIAFQSANHGTLHHFYTLGSAIEYALRYCECPLEAVELCKERGWELHWANQNSVMITSDKRDKEISFMVEHGDRIQFHGKIFEIVPTANDNIALKETEKG